MNKNAKILVVDDDTVVLKAVTQILQREGYQVVPIDDAVEGLTAAKDPSVDVAILDINMPHLSGMDLLKAIKSARPEVEVVMMTAYATVETAVEAVKAGAYDYLTKPFENIDEVSLTVAKAAERKQLKDRTRLLEEQLVVKHQFEDLIGQSNQMRSVFKLVETVSYSTATVLIQGESGTGKELVARAIHFRSPRKDKPFVAVNCSALTDTLLESELFGHMKGSFTGATGNKKGLFEAADGGTIFLDEIGDVPAATQVRLLRVLQEGEVKRVGANEPIKVDVRVIAATNVDLARAIHRASPRANYPFVAINCGAIPETLLESELFGHTKGSFTGAIADQRGLFVAADKGTLFLDEIGDMPLALQVKLLRVIETREVRPIGATRSIPFDVRIISATHRDLAREKENGNFREDLYYRLNVVTLKLPSLDE
ncbi:MAG TPA: sigma 54-interacting transcriptional regulator, partial [Aggregicoccus sp.]|nr:sigma 54-interacting transcriptional regulator [Aggregicoccus sp.]